jgi:hypothetical protein
MPLDSRYLWTVKALDAHDREVTIGAGIQNGQVIVSAPGWFRMDDQTTDEFAYRLQTLAEMVRRQPGSRSS